MEEKRFPRVPRDRFPPAVPRRCFTSWWTRRRRRQGRAVLSRSPVAAIASVTGCDPHSLPALARPTRAFRRATPLDHTTPAPLNIATARLAGVVCAVCVGRRGWGMEWYAHPPAECVGCFANAGFWGALSPISGGGFRGNPEASERRARGSTDGPQVRPSTEGRARHGASLMHPTAWGGWWGGYPLQPGCSLALAKLSAEA